RRPVVEVGDTFRLQGVLILRAAEASADAQVLNRLHKKLRAGDLSGFATQARNNLVGAHLAFVERFELGKHARRAGAVASSREGGDRVDCRSGHDDFVELCELFRHRGEGDVLIALDVTVYTAGVLLRKEAFGNGGVEVAGDTYGDERDQQN